MLHSRAMESIGKQRRYRFGLYEADAASGELKKNGERVRLQEQPFQILLSLLDEPGQVVTRERLRERIWSNETFVDFDHSLNACINKLRDALGDTASNPRFIETLPRRGYRFIAPVETIDDKPTSAAPPNAEASHVPEASTPLPQARRATSRLLFALLQFMYLLFYAIALWRVEECGVRVRDAFGANPLATELVILIAGAVGVCVRLYTLNATLFDYPLLGRNFEKIFWPVLILDLLWALAPFLILHLIGMGLAFACCAALVYSPFAQRVLARMTWRAE